MKTIANEQQLHNRIRELKSQRTDCEQKITDHVREISAVISNPAPIIKRTVKDLAGDKNFKTELLSLGLSFASRYLGGRMGAAGAAGSSVLSLLINKFAPGNSDKISGIAGLISRLLGREKK